VALLEIARCKLLFSDPACPCRIQIFAMTIQVFLVEDDPEFGRHLVELIRSNPLLQLCGWVDTVALALDNIRTSHADVFLVDLGLPDGSGQTIIQHITRVRPSARIMVLSTLGDPKHILSSLEMGAHGYLLKSESPEHILHHIITLVNEGGVLSGLASKIVIQEMAQRHPTSAQRSASGTAPAALTPKELRVLSLVQTGLPAKSIAFHLNISIFTVNQHLRSIYRKLNVRNKMEAVQSALNLGLL
jgi:DNA-binding NarL/FixJ family response regulator